jgi:hypothetical protein
MWANFRSSHWGGAFEARSHPTTVPPARNDHRRPPFPSPPHLYLSPVLACPARRHSSCLRPQVTRDSLRYRRISPSHSRKISGCPRHGRCLRPRATAGGRPLPPHARRPPSRLPPICAAGGATVAAGPVLRIQRGRRRGVRGAL